MERNEIKQVAMLRESRKVLSKKIRFHLEVAEVAAHKIRSVQFANKIKLNVLRQPNGTKNKNKKQKTKQKTGPRRGNQVNFKCRRKK